MGPKEVEEKLGVKPPLVTDYLALTGDTSDNIPGVPGIGDKTARELIAAHGDIDSIYRNLEAIKKPSVVEKLREGKDLAYLSKDLATLRLDITCSVAMEDASLKAPDLKTLRRLFRELEFTALYKEIKIENTRGENGPRWNFRGSIWIGSVSQPPFTGRVPGTSAS